MCHASYTLGGFPRSSQAGCEMPAATGGYQDEGLLGDKGLLKPLPNSLPHQLAINARSIFAYPPVSERVAAAFQ